MVKKKKDTIERIKKFWQGNQEEQKKGKNI